MLFSQDYLSGYTVANSSPGRDSFQGWSRHLWSGSVVKLGVGLHHCCANLPGDHCYSTVLIACLIPIYILPLSAVEEHKQVRPCWRTRHLCGYSFPLWYRWTPGPQGKVVYRQISAMQGLSALIWQVRIGWSVPMQEFHDALKPCPTRNNVSQLVLDFTTRMVLKLTLDSSRPLDWQHGPLAATSDICSHYAVGLRQLHQFFFPYWRFDDTSWYPIWKPAIHSWWRWRCVTCQS